MGISSHCLHDTLETSQYNFSEAEKSPPTLQPAKYCSLLFAWQGRAWKPVMTKCRMTIITVKITLKFWWEATLGKVHCLPCLPVISMVRLLVINTEMTMQRTLSLWFFSARTEEGCSTHTTRSGFKLENPQLPRIGEPDLARTEAGGYPMGSTHPCHKDWGRRLPIHVTNNFPTHIFDGSCPIMIPDDDDLYNLYNYAHWANLS